MARPVFLQTSNLESRISNIKHQTSDLEPQTSNKISYSYSFSFSFFGVWSLFGLPFDCIHQFISLSPYVFNSVASPTILIRLLYAHRHHHFHLRRPSLGLGLGLRSWSWSYVALNYLTPSHSTASTLCTLVRLASIGFDGLCLKTLPVVRASSLISNSKSTVHPITIVYSCRIYYPSS